MTKTVLIFTLIANLTLLANNLKADIVYNSSPSNFDGQFINFPSLNPNAGGVGNSIEILLSASDLSDLESPYYSYIEIYSTYYSSGPLANTFTYSSKVTAASYGDQISDNSAFILGYINALNTSSSYIGFSLNSGISPYFGWFEYSASGVATSDGTTPRFTLKAYAYDNSGAPICVGQTTVPEPSTYALFGIGAFGMLMVMRRKKTA